MRAPTMAAYLAKTGAVIVADCGAETVRVNDGRRMLSVPREVLEWLEPAPVTNSLSLAEAIEAAKAGETVEHPSLCGRYIYAGSATHPAWLKGVGGDDTHTPCGADLEIRSSHFLTGWRIVPKAKPLPKMTQELADALEEWVSDRERCCNDKTLMYSDTRALVTEYRKLVPKGGAK